VLQKKLGQKIARLRKAQQLTQEQMAEALGCSVEFVSLVERGVNAPSVAGLEKFAKVLKVEVKDLFNFGKNPK
jgi:transcriptional regulator with XRE-family HTH domain